MSDFQRVVDAALGVSPLHRSVVEDVPQLRRGRVWCKQCGASRRVDAGVCLSQGWPTCCGKTMTIDSPRERARLKATGVSRP